MSKDRLDLLRALVDGRDRGPTGMREFADLRQRDPAAIGLGLGDGHVIPAKPFRQLAANARFLKRAVSLASASAAATAS